MSELEIHVFPCLADNYGYLLHDPESGVTAAGDTPDASAIAAELDAKGWRRHRSPLHDAARPLRGRSSSSRFRPVESLRARTFSLDVPA